MAGLLYYIPRLMSACNAAEIKKAGLSHAIDAKQIAYCETSAGPDGGSGMVVARSGSVEPVGFYPAKQTWEQSYTGVAGTPAGDAAAPSTSGGTSGGGGLWVGRYNDKPAPGPRDLAREELIAGHWVTLEDGNDWLVPVARSFPNGTKLPQSLSLGPKGELVAKALPRYAAITADAQRYFDTMKEDAAGLPFDEGFRIAAAALAINYRVTAAEVSVLGLLTTKNIESILDALIDMPTLMRILAAQMEAAKKNDPAPTPDGSGSAAGGPGSSPATTPQLSPSSGSSK